MEAQHTPGPWEVVPLSGVGGPFAIRMAYHNPQANPTWYGVQAVGTKADARLIAAAPDLLEALKDYDNAFTDFDPDDQTSRFAMRKVIIAARAAIAKATNPNREAAEALGVK